MHRALLLFFLVFIVFTSREDFFKDVLIRCGGFSANELFYVFFFLPVCTVYRFFFSVRRNVVEAVKVPAECPVPVSRYRVLLIYRVLPSFVLLGMDSARYRLLYSFLFFFFICFIVFYFFFCGGGRGFCFLLAAGSAFHPPGCRGADAVFFRP